MTDIYLLRHGATDAIGHCFSGRLRGVCLNAEGRMQAAALARQLRDANIRVIYSSPSDRARETAGTIAEAIGISIQSNAAFDEIDVGQWTGEPFGTLDCNPEFQRFNSIRSLSRPPSGETMLEVQSRVVGELLRIMSEAGNCSLAVVSHSDVIKAALAYFLGIPIDLASRLEIGLCSISLVRLSLDQVHVVAINRLPESS